MSSFINFAVRSYLLSRSLGSISVLFGQTVRGLSAGARIFEYLLVKPTIPMTGGKQFELDRIQGQVQFRNVSFAYPTRPGQMVLKDFSLDISAGTMVAVCGPSGAGKSTVASLLERFYDVEFGQVMLDGHDIRELDPTWMRGSVIGFIHQVYTIYLFIYLFIYLSICLSVWTNYILVNGIFHICKSIIVIICYLC